MPTISATGNGVVLGSRELRLRLDQRHSKLLQAMAKRYGRSPTELAELLLQEAVMNAANEGVALQMLKTFSVGFGRWGR